MWCQDLKVKLSGLGLSHHELYEHRNWCPSNAAKIADLIGFQQILRKMFTAEDVDKRPSLQLLVLSSEWHNMDAIVLCLEKQIQLM